jgi:4-methyl-5(b-hydroxyethyl)-thiazole monophosphate biosynthesis
MPARIVVVLADGFEEIEAVTPIDVLRRAELDVTTAGVDRLTVTGSHGIPYVCDALISEVSSTPDCIVLPGGLPGPRIWGGAPPCATWC